MKITYVTHTRFPTEKAHGHQIAQVCAAMGKLGHDVTLIHPTIWTEIEGDVWGYYNVEKVFNVQRIHSFDALSAWGIPGFLAFAISMWSYRRALRKFFKSYKTDLFYCRSWEVLDPMLATGIRVTLELHTLPRHGLRKFIEQCNRCWKIVCLTSPMCDEVMRMGVHPDRVIVEGDGVDLGRFLNISSPDVGQEYSCPTSGEPSSHIPIIGYVGSLITQKSMEKGVVQLIEALGILKKRGLCVFGWIIGGPEDRVQDYKEHAKNVGLTTADIRFEGQVESRCVSSCMSQFNICVYPAPRSNHPYFTRDTSPLKLFEYLAAGKPIVCADLPPIRDIVDETMVTFCVPGDPESLADAIIWVLDHPAEAQEKARKGRAHVKKFDWQERMGRILHD